MKRTTALVVLSALFLSSCNKLGDNATSDKATQISLVDYVNPLMGTDSKYSLSNGNTYPAIATPWGMNFWTPMTSPMGDGWTYQYNENKIRGIKQTHQPSPWINDYAAFSLMALTGKMKFEENERASWFSHKAESVKPHHYKVYLADYDVVAEVTPTERAAHFRFTFPESDSSYVILDGFNMGSMVRIIPEERKVVGYCRSNHGGVPENFHNYFVAEFDKDFDITHEALVNESRLVLEMGPHANRSWGDETSEKLNRARMVIITEALTDCLFESVLLIGEMRVFAYFSRQ